LPNERSPRDDHLATLLCLKRRLLGTRRAGPHRALVERSRADEAHAITPQELVERVVLRSTILHGPDSSRKWVSEAAEVSSAAEQPHNQNDDQDNSEYSANAITTTAGVVSTAIISESTAEEKYK
jgi:hypothetical protein